MKKSICKIDANGNKRWYLNGKLHRTDGPAVEFANGTKYWHLDDKLHRADGPAIEYANGDKYWYLDDKLHRIDGPAIERASGYKSWYIDNKQIHCKSQEEFEILTMKPYSKDDARDLAYSLLHDEQGISKDSYEKLHLFMIKYGVHTEIQRQVYSQDNRFFILMNDNNNFDYTDPACTCILSAKDTINDTCPIHGTEVPDEYLHGD